MRVKNLLIRFFCVFGTSLFAQTTSLKHYSDELQNFDGWANAVFEESIKGSEYENNADLVIEAISKKLSESPEHPSGCAIICLSSPVFTPFRGACSSCPKHPESLFHTT